MNVRHKSRLLNNSVALITVVGIAGLLAGCTTTSRSPFAAPLVTNSVNTAQNADLNQSMPSVLGAPNNGTAPIQMAQSSNAPFTPPANVGAGGSAYPSYPNNGSQDPLLAGGYPQTQASNTNFGTPAAPSQISQQPLPSLTPIPVKSTPIMTASPSPAQIQTTPQALVTPTGETANMRVVPDNAFMHKIEAGESLYVIARRYDVSADAIVQANGLASADRIFVGQELIIPGRPDLIAKKAISTPAPAPQKVASVTPLATPNTSNSSPQPISRPNDLKATPPPAQQPQAQASAQVEQPKQAAPQAVETPKADEVKTAAVPTSTASIAPTQAAAPVSSGFRWPVSGRMIQDFKASKNTGINIEAPEGSAVRAADGGTVIYTGSAVEGYGNLVLIKHENGYVSAYAHLKDINVAKGATVGRGEQIGSVGFTGSVARPQLHFELRKGATPVDPAPLLSS